MRAPVVFITEPLLSPEFTQFRAVVPVAARLTDEFDVAVAAPAIDAAAARAMEASGVTAISGGARFPRPRTPRDEVPSFILSWSRDALLGLNRRAVMGALDGRPRFVVNISMTNCLPSDIWYAMSRPLGDSLTSIRPNLAPVARWAVSVGEPAVDLVAEHHLRRTAGRARTILASTEYVARMYRNRGFRVEGTIPVFLYPETFRPTTATPARDYILAYLGKETDMKAINDLGRLGFPIRLFGGKSGELVRSHLGRNPPPNVQILGAVSHERLLDLYSNALFTAFPFTDESFGLVPIESMACGTPVLTYAAQGPGETVRHEETGWLAQDETDFIGMARTLLARGYPPAMGAACQRRSTRYQLSSVVEEWRKLLRSGTHGQSHGPTSAASQPGPMGGAATGAVGTSATDNWVGPT